jgi:hypothetical protein
LLASLFRYPWLKSRGPIETLLLGSSIPPSLLYPWLKSRGPIETVSWILTYPFSG